MKKKFICICLALATVFTMLSVSLSVSAEETEGQTSTNPMVCTSLAQLKSALENSRINYVRFDGDCSENFYFHDTYERNYIVLRKEKHLELNGNINIKLSNMLSGYSTSFIYMYSDSSLTITGNGSIYVDYSSGKQTYENLMFANSTKTTVNILGGNYTITGNNSLFEADDRLSSKTNIYGGNFTSEAEIVDFRFTDWMGHYDGTNPRDYFEAYGGTFSYGDHFASKYGNGYSVSYYVCPRAYCVFLGGTIKNVTETEKNYFVDNNSNITVNGTSAPYTITGNISKPDITKVDITEFYKPVHASSADYTASTTTPGCNVYDIKYSLNGKVVANYSPIVGDKLLIAVYVNTTDGFSFSTKADRLYAQWNELSSSQVLRIDTDKRCFVFEYTVQAGGYVLPVSSASINIDKPEDGKVLPSSATTSSTKFSVGDIKWTYNGTDVTGKIAEGGKEYKCLATLQIKDGYMFNSPTEVYINGNKAVVESSTGDTLTASYSFKAEKTALLGDINLDGNITVNDVTLLQKYLASIEELNPTQLSVADTDKNGTITVNDVTQLQKYLAGLVTL